MTSAGARMSAEQRRRSAPKSDAAATSAIGDGAAVRGGGEASPTGLFGWGSRRAAWRRQRFQASDFERLGLRWLPGRQAAYQVSIQTS